MRSNEEKIHQLLGFQPTDLAYNRRGQLSPPQAVKFRNWSALYRRKTGWGATFFRILLVAGVLGGAGYVYWRSGVLPIDLFQREEGLLVAGILGGALLSVLLIMLLAKSGGSRASASFAEATTAARVTRLTGPLHIFYESPHYRADYDNMYGGGWHLQVNSESVLLLNGAHEQLQQLLQPQALYHVYVFEANGSRWLVSLEAAD